MMNNNQANRQSRLQIVLQPAAEMVFCSRASLINFTSVTVEPSAGFS